MADSRLQPLQTGEVVLNRTAKALRLDYYSLKKHLPIAAGAARIGAEFVEIVPGGMAAVRPECVIEVEDASGTKMRIHLHGGSPPDVAALLGVFREGRP